MESQESPGLTMQMLQSGYIQLSSPIKYGILLLGNTKAGKTTTSHLLTHQLLQGGKNNVKNIVYHLKEGQKKYEGAKIGDKQSVSETQIPNFFDVEEDGQKIKLIDCPGYLDSFGCYRIISNRFFHNQVFTKVENAKFILVFRFSHMLQTANDLKKTLQQFLGSFTNYQQIKNDLINATSIVITSVPRDQSLDSVRKIFQECLPSIGGQYKEIYADLKVELLKKNRIFIFPVAQLGKPCDIQNTILKEINSVTTFWKRDVKQSQEADMKYINIQIAKYFQQDDEQFDAQLKVFSQFYKKIILANINKLTQVLKKLTQDNIKYGESSQFLDKILSSRKQMIDAKANQNNVFDLYTKYEKKRSQLKESFFAKDKDSSLGSLGSQSDLPFPIAKLRARKNIQKIVSVHGIQQGSGRDIQFLEKKAKSIKNILGIIYELAKLKKQKNSAKDDEKNRAVLDFAYEIHKDIEISNRLYHLITCSNANKGKPTKNAKLEKGCQFILKTYPLTLKGIFLQTVCKTSDQILYQNLKSIKVERNLSPKSLFYICSLLQQFKGESQKMINQSKDQSEFLQKLTPEQKEQFIKDLDDLILSVDSNIPLTSLKAIEAKMSIIAAKLQKTDRNDKKYEKLAAQNNKVLEILAAHLYKSNKIDLSINVYDCLFDGYKVLELLKQKQQKARITKKQNELLDILIMQMKKAGKYQRKQLACQKAQEAYHMAASLADIPNIKLTALFIKNLYQGQSSQTQEYIQFMFDSAPAVKLPEGLKEQIRVLAADQSPQKKI